ncbi:hypothetical protein [Caballeronia ptereochthonis]|uniref:DUF2780 domain-containing protein n=1 Tax=Caballeronia ptereochthonis TaxID=1777144 RepID=A0A158AU31_9BURK|nr:hypothetical protein [Caballeronia ptereochthonis]SAK61458.1 hypothetical protein AWB83_02378 [Caballeronia ptereochthonis]
MPNRSSRIALLSAGIAFALIAPAAAYAQLNLQQFGFGSGKSEVAAGANGAAQPSALNSLVQNYLGANQQVLSGQSSLASAMGMSSVASQAQSAAGLLSGASGGSGVPSTSVLSQLGGTQQSVSQSLMQAFSSGSTTPPTAANKQTFSDGLASLGQGVKQYAGLQSDLGSVKNSMNMSSLLQAGSNPGTAQAATYIAQSAPGQLQSLVQTLTQAVQYAKTNGISIPSIATSALSGAK